MGKFLPIFPLQLVVFPGEKLKLHIFEPRYKQLIGECRDDDITFGLPAHIDGRVSEYGTEMRLINIFETYDDGRMDILADGVAAFHLDTFIREVPEKLYFGAQVTVLRNIPDAIPHTTDELARQYERLHELMRTGYMRDTFVTKNVSYQIAQEVGLTLSQKIELLALEKEADRQEMLERLLIEPARRMPDCGFLIGGSQYPQDFPWQANIRFIDHVPPEEHPAFYSSAKLNLSVTRGVMAAMGYCPSGRLFEAAACEAPVLTDYWEGLEQFFEPGKEILVATTTEEAMEHLSRPAEELQKIGKAARQRVLDQHTAEKRALEMEAAIEAAMERTLAQAFNRQTAGGK